MAAEALDGRQRELAAGLDVAAAVKDFYERYPHPRPTDDLDNYQRRWQDRNRRRADFHLFWPDEGIGAQQLEFAPKALGLATAVVVEDRLSYARSHRHYSSKDGLWTCREGWTPFMSPA